MSSDEPNDPTRRWRELLSQQTEMARSWFEAPWRLEIPTDWGFLGTATEESLNLASGVTELFRSWMELGGSLRRSLLTMNDDTGVAAGTLGRLLDPVSLSLVGGSQVGDAIRRMTEGPRFADLGALERGTAKALELWLAVQAAARGYEQVVAAGWTQASQRFGVELAKRQRDANRLLKGKEALALWLEVANQTLLENQRSSDFLTAQRSLLRSGMDFLLAERELVESLAEPAGLPTRTEIDEVHRSVQDLKRRVRTLEKQLTDARRETAPHATRDSAQTPDPESGEPEAGPPTPDDAAATPAAPARNGTNGARGPSASRREAPRRATPRRAADREGEGQ